MLQLIEIQKKQFSDKHGAEHDLLRFLQAHEDKSINKVELQPKPESLNSLNGFVTFETGERYFFKTHTEENEKVSEYYNAEELARAGYPVITSKQITQKVGSQIVLYEIISHPTLFDLLKTQEDKELSGTGCDTTAHTLLKAQTNLDKLVASIYEKTLVSLSQQEQASAPINQLFAHRLADDGRLGIFYRHKSTNLGGVDIAFDDLETKKWTINGVAYTETLEQIIERSRQSLAAVAGPGVAGHGDAHNGNIFVDLEQQKLYMFDPAFAGQHHPLLDLTKPLFHNVFARWMYYPEQVVKELSLTATVNGDSINVEHNFHPSALRLSHLHTRVQNVLRPTLALLKKTNQLDDNWRDYVRSALFCCPFLTVNLFAEHIPNGTLSERYQPAIKALGMAMAIELGAMTHRGSSRLTDVIDEVFD